MTRPTKPLDVYVRVSQVRGREGASFISPDVQEERCRAAAAARGIAVGRVFTDLDATGATMQRPEFEKALVRIKSGESGGILVARVDRFARTLVKGLQTIEEITAAGGVVIAADGDFDTSTATGRLVLNVMLTLAQFELERIGEGWRAAQERAVRRGVAMGPIAFGYKRGKDGVLVPKEPEATRVRRAFEARAGGAPMREVAAILGEGHHHATASRLLRRRVYLGELTRGDTTVEHAHEPLVDIATWLAAQHDRRPRPPAREGAWLLSGMLRCEGCGFKMTRSRNGYVCNNGRARGCTAPASIDRGFVELLALYALLHPFEGVEVEEPATDLAPYESALTRAVERFEQAQGVEVQDALGHEAWIAMLGERRRDLEEAQAALGTARAGRAEQPGRHLVVDEIIDAPVSEQRTVLMDMFDFFSVNRETDDVTAWLHGTAPADLPRAGKRNGGRPRPLKPVEAGTVFKVSPDDAEVIRIEPVPHDSA